jgi:hypothetical protein
VPLLVVAGTRPPEGEGHDPILAAELIADPEAAAIRPEPLGRASIAVLAAWPYNIGFLAHALLERGEADEAARVIDRGGFPEQLPLDQVHLVWFRLHRARVRIETGNPERGVEELRQVGQTVRLLPFDNPTGAPWRSWAAEGLRLLDRNDQARALAAEAGCRPRTEDRRIRARRVANEEITATGARPR